MKKRFGSYLKANNNKISLNVGKVSLIEKIGEGGNGIVYSAEIYNHTFAIKFLLSDSSGDSLKIKAERFLAEYFNIVSINDSKGIIKYIDYDILKITDEEGELFVPTIIMKKYHNSLKVLSDPTILDEFEKIFNFLIETVGKIHNEGIIHRDIKPENILQDDNGLVLADFGIASYNPEFFNLMAKTKKTERIGNRLFSSPEQEVIGTKAKETMDIYAIGQVLHWIIYSETHRGTNRKRISKKNIELSKYDNIIDKCLSNNPDDRFQSINEIKEFVKTLNKPKRSIWSFLYDFGNILARNFPKNETGFVHSDNIKMIDNLFEDIMLNEDKFKTESQNELWWHNGSGNLYFKFHKKGDGIWKLNDREMVVKEIWIHYDLNYYNDFIIVHYKKGDPFLIDGKETNYTVIVDDKFHITYSEYDNKYAVIEDKVVDLKNHKVELIERFKEEGYLIIALRYHCILRTKNDTTVRAFLEKLEYSNGNLKLEDFQDFEYQIRMHKMPQIEDDL